MPKESLPEQVKEARDFLSSRIENFPRIGVILGSGLGYLVDEMSTTALIPYSAIPGFASPSVDGHFGILASGKLDGVGVIALKGRSHYYEGIDLWRLTFPVRVLAALGVEVLIVTNAAGGLCPDFKPGDLMIITDHINIPGLGGANPLVGLNEPAFGQRFLDMTGAYDKRLIELAADLAIGGNCSLHKGVYVMVSGPSYETPAEVRFLRAIGGDAVGMSTVPEVVVARQCGIKVLGVSCISNVASLDGVAGTSHEQVLVAIEAAKPVFAQFIREVLKGI